MSRYLYYYTVVYIPFTVTRLLVVCLMAVRLLWRAHLVSRAKVKKDSALVLILTVDVECILLAMS